MGKIKPINSPPLKILLLLIYIISVSCQEQDVITNIVANYGKVEISVTNDGEFGGIPKFKKDPYSTVKVTIKNIGQLSLSRFSFPEKLPHPLYYKTAPKRGMKIFNQNFAERDSKDLSYRTLKNSEITPEIEEQIYTKDTSYLYKCDLIENIYTSEYGFCEFEILIYSEEKIDFNYIFEFSYNDGVYQNIHNLLLTGSIADPGILDFSTKKFQIFEEYLDYKKDLTNAGESLIFEPIAFGMSATSTIQLFNTGERKIEIYSIDFSSQNDYFNFTGGSFPGINGNCKSRMEPHEICTVEIIYQPTYAIDILKRNDETHNTILNLKYFDSVSDRSIDIPISGRAKEERGRIEIIKNISANIDPTCMEIPSQYCYGLGLLALGHQEIFSLGIKNVGLIKSTLYPPKIKIESIFEEPFFIDFVDQEVPYLILDSEYTDEKKCLDSLEPGESCNFYFKFNSNPILNQSPINYIGTRSFLISFPYLDNDIINPQKKFALIENEVPNENNIETINRVKVSGDILLPAMLTFKEFTDSKSNSILEEFIEMNNKLELPPTKLGTKFVLNFKIKNIGVFDASKIQVTKNTDLSSDDNNFQFNILKNYCPSLLTSKETDYCDFSIIIQGDKKGNFTGVFNFLYHNGVEVVSSENYEISVYYVNTPSLDLSIHTITADPEVFTPFNSNKDQLVKNLNSPKLKLILKNKGLGSANNIQIKFDKEMLCKTPLYPVDINATTNGFCELEKNFDLEPMGSELSVCEIEFTIKPKIEPDDPNFILENCTLNITAEYNDEINTDIAFKNPKNESLSFRVGELANLYALSSDDYAELFLISDNELILDRKTEMANYLNSLDDIIIDLGTTPKGVPIKSNFLIYNFGGINPIDLSITQDLPSNFEIFPSSNCENLTKASSCLVEVNFQSNESKSYKHKNTISYINGNEVIQKNYFIKAKSGDYGNLVFKDKNDNDYATKTNHNIGSFIIQKEENVQLKFYNNGTGNISNLRFNNSETEIIEGTETETIDYFEILPSSQCLSNGLILQPNEYCYFDVILRPTQAIEYSFQMNLLFNNTAEEKNYIITQTFNGQTPPNIQIEFTGGNSTSEFDFGKIPNDSKKEKTFNIRNNGQTEATDFSISLDPAYSEFFKISYTTCNIPNKTLGPLETCTMRVNFFPTTPSNFELDENNEKVYEFYENLIKIYYNPIIPPEAEDLPFDHLTKPLRIVNLKGISIIPEATFTYYSDIYAVNKNGETSVRFAWDSFISGSSEIEIDSHHIYMREGEQLPTNEVELEKYKIDMILGNAKNDRIFTKTLSSNPGDIIYFSIRPKYLDNVLNIPIINQRKVIPWNLKIIIPPENMALIHPFIVNDSTCRSMKFRPDFENSINQENALYLLEPLSAPSDVYFTCPKEKILNDKPDESGNQYTYNYYNFNRFLFVNLYELSKTPAGYYYNVENALPHEFNVPITAENACKTKLHNMNTFGNKVSRLLTREEWLAAAEWSPLISANKLEQIEKGDIITGCFSGKNEQIPVSTGSRADCVSRFGVHDMIGNLWEWNKNQINTVIGLDELLGTYLLIPGGISVEFPKNIPCFNFIHGIGTLPQTKDGKPYCPEGVFGSSISAKNQSYYFPPNPMISGIKQFRSGGGIGEKFGADNESVKLTGRYVSDLDSSTAFFTGGRCGFSLPFNND